MVIYRWRLCQEWKGAHLWRSAAVVNIVNVYVCHLFNKCVNKVKIGKQPKTKATEHPLTRKCGFIAKLRKCPIRQVDNSRPIFSNPYIE